MAGKKIMQPAVRYKKKPETAQEKAPVSELMESAAGVGNLSYYLKTTGSHKQATRLNKLGKKHGHDKVARSIGRVKGMLDVKKIEEEFEKKYKKVK